MLRNLSDFLEADKSFDEVIKSIADENNIRLDSNDGKMLKEISKIAVENLESKEKIKEKAIVYFKTEVGNKEKIDKNIENKKIDSVIIHFCEQKPGSGRIYIYL